MPVALPQMSACPAPCPQPSLPCSLVWLDVRHSSSLCCPPSTPPHRRGHSHSSLIGSTIGSVLFSTEHPCWKPSPVHYPAALSGNYTVCISLYNLHTFTSDGHRLWVRPGPPKIHHQLSVEGTGQVQRCNSHRTSAAPVP